jgi:aspartate aminotransferase
MPVSDKMRAAAERSSWIRKMFEEGARMKAEFGADKVFDLSIGNPDAPPPEEFNKVLAEVAQNTSPGVHGYMPNGGFPWVRDALAPKISKEQGVTVTGADMLMTCGAAGGLNIAFKAILNPDDEVILLSPYFVDYGYYVDNHGGKSVVVATAEDFTLDLEAIESAITARTRAIIVNSPNNPTGQIYSEASLAELGAILEKHSDKHGRPIFIISDEPYKKIVYEETAVPSIFAASTNSMVVTSYSKELSLPGERIGFIVVHPDLRGKAQLLDALTMANRILGFINAPALMQRVVAELQDTSVDTQIYAKRKEIICRILREGGYDFTEPRGSFYVFPKTPIEDDVAFVAMLQEEKILTVPGRGFGAPGHMRIAFCVDSAIIERAAEGFKRAYERATA